MINGRTESQVKNRFKLILRRESIQQSNTDPKELKDSIIPAIIERLKNTKDEIQDEIDMDQEEDSQMEHHSPVRKSSD